MRYFGQRGTLVDWFRSSVIREEKNISFTTVAQWLLHICKYLGGLSDHKSLWNLKKKSNNRCADREKWRLVVRPRGWKISGEHYDFVASY